MKTKYFKQGGLGIALVAIYQLQEGSGIGYTFSDEPQALQLEKGDVISDVVEISEREFSVHYDTWVTLLSIFSEKIREQEFIPKTKYSVILGGFTLVGFSQRTPPQLSKFFQDSKQFEVLNEEGTVVALLKENFIRAASYIFEEI